jgi:transposase
MLYVGWDWASRQHAVAVVDERGAGVDRWASAALPVAIERADGAVVERLLEAGHPVVPVHAAAFHAARPRWGAARAESDPGDAFKLADYLRTDGHRLRRLSPPDEPTRQLQALVRTRSDHVAARVAAANQLAALLGAHWPGATAVFARLDSDIALDFLERYPTPEAAARLGEARMAASLRRRSYCGRRAAGELLARLRAAPAAVARLDPEALAECVRAQAGLLRALRATIADLDRAIAAALPEHPKAALLATLPRVGTVNLAQILAEVGPILARAADVEHAAAEVGAVPVTRSSGKARAVCFRWAANARARQALGTWADNSRHASPWAATLYRDARARGKRHPHAVRILARAWLRVVWACWHTGTPYDPARHRAEQALAAA